MEAPSHISDILRGIDLAWWPGFLLANAVDRLNDEDSFTVSLLNLATSLAEEASLA